MKLLRVLKAIGSTAATWGAVWSLLSLPTLWHLFNSAPPGIPAGPLPVSAAVTAWLYAFAHGAVIGASFAVVLHLGARWIPALRQLSFARVGLLGAVAAGGVGVVILGPSIGVVGGLVLAGLGASTAVVSLLVARRAPDRALAVPSSIREITST
jgi:hypothetical protein